MEQNIGHRGRLPIPIDKERLSRIITRLRLSGLSISELRRRLGDDAMSQASLQWKLRGLRGFTSQEVEEIEDVLDSEIAEKRQELLKAI